MNRIFLSFLLAFTFVVTALPADARVWQWNTNGDTESWTAGNAIASVAATGGELIATYGGSGYNSYCLRVP